MFQCCLKCILLSSKQLISIGSISDIDVTDSEVLVCIVSINGTWEDFYLLWMVLRSPLWRQVVDVCILSQVCPEYQVWEAKDHATSSASYLEWKKNTLPIVLSEFRR